MRLVVNNWKLLLFVLPIAVFLVFRLYSIHTSLLFFNDMGRDFSVLLDWYESGKPPLLGPQTSAFSFNQSAFYFYLLFPAFLLTNHSAFSSIYTVIFCYLLAFLFGIWIYRNDKTKLVSLWLVGLLVTLQPQAIIQHRFVWNPSFVLLFMIIASFAFLEMRHQLNWKNLTAFSLGVAAAISFNYSALPAVASLFLVGMFFWRKKTWLVVVATSVAGLLLNLPTIFFELRHKFVLTKLLIEGQTLMQVDIGFWGKMMTLEGYLVGYKGWVGVVISLLLMALIVVGLQIYWKRKQHAQFRSLLSLSLASLICFVLTFILPFNIESHYIFGLMSLLIMTMALLPLQLVLFVALLSLLWLLPIFTKRYFLPARRTVADMQTCYRDFCDKNRQPLYVSMQSGILPYHNAPEHRFLMREAGCKVLNIEDNQDQSRQMAVVVDDSKYEHGKTAYNELTLFGQSSVGEEYHCTEKLQIILLKK
ncbi:MAG: hypothetical protein ACOZAN_03240 [Patescibacteria group bacterium]